MVEGAVAFPGSLVMACCQQVTNHTGLGPPAQAGVLGRIGMGLMIVGGIAALQDAYVRTPMSAMTALLALGLLGDSLADRMGRHDISARIQQWIGQMGMAVAFLVCLLADIACWYLDTHHAPSPLFLVSCVFCTQRFCSHVAELDAQDRAAISRGGLAQPRRVRTLYVGCLTCLWLGVAALGACWIHAVQGHCWIVLALIGAAMAVMSLAMAALACPPRPPRKYGQQKSAAAGWARAAGRA